MKFNNYKVILTSIYIKIIFTIDVQTIRKLLENRGYKILSIPNYNSNYLYVDVKRKIFDIRSGNMEFLHFTKGHQQVTFHELVSVIKGNYILK